MPVQFPQFDIDDVEPDIKTDLEIIEEDKTLEIQQPKPSPFVNPPQKKKVFKPLPPTEQSLLENKVQEEDKAIEKVQKKERKKKALSEKQRKHLENMRLKKANKKMEQVKQAIKSTSNEHAYPNYKEPTPEELADMEKAEFDVWLKNMSKFEKIMKKMEIEKQKEVELQQKREAMLEAKYRAKFEAEQKAKKDYEKKTRPLPKGSLAQPDVPINFNPLQQTQENQYDKYFSF